MRNQIRILLWTVALAIVGVWGPEATRNISDLEVFRVRSVEVRGMRFLTEDSVVALLRTDEAASVWSDKAVWRERLERHPMIREAEVTRRPPHGLLVRVEERSPVALAPTPTLEPVDAEGYRLPVDPTRYRLDLPVLASRRVPPGQAKLVPGETRALATEVARIASMDPDFLRRVSSVAWGDRGSLVVRLTAPDVVFLMNPGTSSARLRQADTAMEDAMSRAPGRVPEVVDLRFADQIVVRRTRAE